MRTDEPAEHEPTGRATWLLAGQDLLREGGPRAVKLHALAERVGLTTGSFYHHFGSMGGYLEELARYFGTEQPATLLERIDRGDARARLAGLGELERDADMSSLYAAMRAWAAHDRRAADAVRAADRTLLEFIEQAFLDLGFGRADARRRAELLFAVGVARVVPPWPPAIRSVDQALSVLAPTGSPAPDRP